MRRHTYFVLLALLLALAACGQPAAPQPTAAPAEAPQPTAAPAEPTVALAEPTVAPEEAAVEVTDSAGRTVSVAAPPARIVSLAPSTTEILFALGVGPQVVAVDDFSNFPAEEVDQLPKIGSFGTINAEQIVALEPDLVLAAGTTAPEIVQQLSDLGLTVVVAGAPEATVESIFSDIELVGQATGQSERAAELTAAMRARFAEVTGLVAQASERPTVFWELDATDPAKPYTVGPGSFIDELIGLAGGTNIFGEGDNPYPQVSAEQIVAADPQVIILADAQYGVAVESVGQRPGWDVISAVREGRVYPIDSDLVSRPGPRVIEGLEAIARLLHPDLF